MIAIRTFSHPHHKAALAQAQSSLGAWLNEFAREVNRDTSRADAGTTQQAPAAASSAANATLETISPRVSVQERGDSYEVQAELPGIAREHIKVAVEGKRVSIHTTLEPVVENIAQNPDAAATTAKLIYTNRVSANYARSFTLPEAVNAEAVNASLENGVLTLRLPKLAAVPVHHITIQ
jgi:HSP20 family protein